MIKCKSVWLTELQHISPLFSLSVINLIDSKFVPKLGWCYLKHFSDSKYHVGIAFLFLTFSYLLFCFRINMHLWMFKDLSHCHIGWFQGKLLRVDYSTALKINVAEILGSHLVKRKKSFTTVIQHSLWIWTKNAFIMYESRIGSIWKLLKFHRRDEEFLNPWSQTGKNSAWVFRNQAIGCTLLRVVT